MQMGGTHGRLNANMNVLISPGAIVRVVTWQPKFEDYDSTALGRYYITYA